MNTYNRDKRIKISIAVLSYNEEGNIENCYRSIKMVADNLPQYDYEILFADNCSTDKTPTILREIAQEDPEHVKVILNAANFGIDKSGLNLINHVSGDVYIGAAADLQEPIEMLPEFMKYWEEGYDIVWGQKNKSEENPIKYACRSVFYNIIDFFSDNQEIHQTDGFGIMDRKVLDYFHDTRMQDYTVLYRNLAVEYGFKIKLLPYTQRKRKWGKTSFNFYRYFSFAISMLCTTSVKPLHLLTVGGFLIGLISIVVGLYYFFYKISHWNTFNAGIAPLVVGMFFLGGVIIFGIGMLGEYIAVIIRRVSLKPPVREKELINFDHDN